jgi:putative hemolysin
MFGKQREELWRMRRGADAAALLNNVLEQLEVTCEILPADLEHVPREGPAVVVANHPFGMLEGVVLAKLLTGMRPDVKILANRMLAEVPELQELCFFVDPFETAASNPANRRPVREALAWLRSGGLLVVFPAGEVSQWNVRSGRVEDRPWRPAAARLALAAGACTVPVYFPGANGIGFQLLGLFSKRLRTASLPLELLNKRGKRIEIRIGRPVTHREIAALPGAREATQYLRSRTYLLARRGAPVSLEAGRVEPASSPFASGDWEREIAALPASQLLQETREFTVHAARAAQIPSLLCEIGRLRETTFRAAGEGTGRDVDLDRFDRDYWHLFLWSKTRREVAGAYRIGRTAEILPARGVRGLYTSTLFTYDPRFFARIGPALELGRSFVRQEYQKQYAPLLLLWKGITRFVMLSPEAAVLFGAVSIAASYSPASRRLIVEFCRRNIVDRELAPYLKPKRPFRAWLRDWEMESVCSAARSLEDLDPAVADLEPDGKGVPVLLRQYVRMGGRLLQFHVDPAFSNTLDGLVVVDLRRTERAILERYMTREGAAAFLAAHRGATAA